MFINLYKTGIIICSSVKMCIITPHFYEENTILRVRSYINPQIYVDTYLYIEFCDRSLHWYGVTYETIFYINSLQQCARTSAAAGAVGLVCVKLVEVCVETKSIRAHIR